MKKNNLRYILYARKSSESKEKQITSINDQIDEAKKHSKQHDLFIKKTIKEDRSAFKPHIREGFDKMLELIKEGKADAIITWKPNRICRNPEEGGKVLQMLQDGILKEIRTSQGGIYTQDSDHLILQIHFGMANQYSRNISTDVKRSLIHKVERGEYPRRAPLGFSTEGERGKKNLVPHEFEADIIRELFELASTGTYSLNDLAEFIASKEIRTKAGKEIGKSHIHSIIKNPLYYGWFLFHGELMEGSYESLISKRIFDQAQIALSDRSKPRKQKWDEYHFYNGLIKCGECGASITTTVKRKYFKRTNRTAHYYYNHCTKRKGKCSQKPISLSTMEEILDNTISLINIDQETWDIGMKLFRAKYKEESNINLNHLSHLQKRYQRIQERLDKLIIMRADEELTKEEFIQQKNSLVEDQVRMSEKIEDAKDSSKSWLHEAEKFLDTALSAKSVMNDDDFMKKRELILTVGENLILKDKKIDITFKKPYDILIKTSGRTNMLPR